MKHDIEKIIDMFALKTSITAVQKVADIPIQPLPSTGVVVAITHAETKDRVYIPIRFHMKRVKY